MRLTLDGLEMPSDFPSAPFECAYFHVRANLAGQVRQHLNTSAVLGSIAARCG